MLGRVMVVVLLGCVGLTAGVALGTLASGNEVTAPAVLYLRISCHHSASHLLLPSIRVHHKHWTGSAVGPCPRVAHVRAPDGGRPRGVHFLPKIIESAPSGRLSMGSYVLLGLLAGLSAALGFLVPPRSHLTRR
jgi:hypothetical protein